MYLDKNGRGIRDSVVEDLHILEEITDYHPRIVGATMLVDGRQPVTKGEYISFILANSKEFRIIDSAIPIEYWESLERLGLNMASYAYAYYENGMQGLVNIMAEYAKIINHGRG